MQTIRKILVSAFIAPASTLFTGAMDRTPAMLTGATWYGYPATWLRRLVIAPQYNPWRVDLLGLAIDLLFWFAVTAVILFATDHKRHKIRQ